tara:strand:+ start:1256 stop:2095 length:840 start_codon:yes stop_codon:yes gene_type:complete
MLLYGKHKFELEKSFLIKKLLNNNRYWNYRLFSDHLSRADYLVLAKSFIKREKIIYYSLESTEHSYRYFRPINCSLKISHLGKKSLYFNLLANEYLSGYFKTLDTVDSKIDETVFISSNYRKISDFFKLKKDKDIKLFGLYATKVPDETNDYYLNAQMLFSKYKSAICLENSAQNGYLQGSYIPVLMAKSVPIINTNPNILRNILNPKTYISIDDYLSLNNSRIKSLINEKLEFIRTNSVESYFTSLFSDYLKFLGNINTNNMEEAIRISQIFKKQIFH